MNKFEAMKTQKDGLDVLPDLMRYAADRTPVEEIPEDDLDRMKWYGVFHRKQTPGLFMMRLRTPGGRVTGEQLRVIAEIARNVGHGSADLTTRQNLQLRGVTLPDVPAVLARLEAAGITTRQSGMDNVRNLVGCPLAGIDAAEVYDTTPLLRELQKAFLGLRDFSNLPRKFNISLAGCREDCGHAQTQDLGFLPAMRIAGGRRLIGFNVLVGGALGGTSPRLATPLDVFLPPAEITPFFLALLAVYRDHGPREQRTKARLKWLIEAWGEQHLRDALEQQLERPLERAGSLQTLRTAGSHLGVHPERTMNVNYVGLHVPVGRITADQLDGVSRLAAEYGSGEVRLTVDQNLVIPQVTDARLDRLLCEPLLRELQPNPSPIWRNLICCTGSDYCHFSLIDTKSRAVELAQTLEARGVRVAPGTRIHMSGCIHACGKHPVGGVGLLGANVRRDGRVVEAIHLFAGGQLGEDARLADPVQEGVTFEELPDVAEALLRDRFAEKDSQARATHAWRNAMEVGSLW